MVDYSPRRTLSPTNEFVFTCPVFSVETKIADCFRLRDRVWRGEQIEVRKGCQACLAASKCPIVRIMSDMIRSGSDPYHAETKRIGRLEPTLLNSIAPIIVPERTLDKYAVGGRERELILAANGKAGSTIRISDYALESVAPTRRRRSTTEPVTHEVTAAETGDMSAAITAAVAAPAVPVPKAITPKPTPPAAPGRRSLLDLARRATEGHTA